MNFLVNLQSLRASGQRRAAGLQAEQPRRLVFEEALELGSFGEVHRRLTACSERGAVVWESFDITEFGSYMPSMATFDALESAEGAPDFVYRFCGENINRVAKRPLRGRLLSEVLTGPSRAAILAEYRQTLAEAKPSASTDTVDISDMFWVRYLRFLYPVRRDGKVDRLLNFMLFASRNDGESGFAKSAL
ncbi:MAG: hypothetical protein WDZ84_10680 [Rhodovibrionaceae bacterium]